MEKNNRQKNKRNRKRHAELERIALYAVGVILLGLVIGLAVKNYRLKSKLIIIMKRTRLPQEHRRTVIIRMAMLQQQQQERLRNSRFRELWNVRT